MANVRYVTSAIQVRESLVNGVVSISGYVSYLSDAEAEDDGHIVALFEFDELTGKLRRKFAIKGDEDYLEPLPTPPAEFTAAMERWKTIVDREFA